jgi:cation diffusion facilitator family transporter
METKSKGNSVVNMQKSLLIVSIVLFIIKIIAWYLTDSVAILTDALESTVNVVAGIIGLYSIILSAKPKDQEHPYGHGKVEFLSSALEGLLISIAGLVIVYESLNNLIHPHVLQKLDSGMILIAITAVVNFIMGHLCIRKGKKESSPILVASGQHLKSDTYSTLGILLGVFLIYITGYLWLDSVAALIMAFVIIYTGYKIIRRSISGIMDESDTAIINEIVVVLNEHRRSEWIDVHNMRVINYAGFYHIDCHLTVPYYINVNQAHALLDALTDMLRLHFKERVEFFIHIDGCVPKQCSLCSVQDCPNRQKAFNESMEWTYSNIVSNSKHGLS